MSSLAETLKPHTTHSERRWGIRLRKAKLPRFSPSGPPSQVSSPRQTTMRILHFRSATKLHPCICEPRYGLKRALNKQFLPWWFSQWIPSNFRPRWISRRTNLCFLTAETLGTWRWSAIGKRSISLTRFKWERRGSCTRRLATNSRLSAPSQSAPMTSESPSSSIHRGTFLSKYQAIKVRLSKGLKVIT